MQYNQQPREEHPPHAGEQRIERWRNQAREQLRKEQEQATGRMRRLKTRIEPLSGTEPIIPQPSAVTPWHGCGDNTTLDIFETPTVYEMKAITLPKTRARNHDSDIPPEQEMVYVSNGKWHFDSSAHMPDRATLNAVVERYYQDFHRYPSNFKFEVSEGFYANLCIFNILEMHGDLGIYHYKDQNGCYHPIQIAPNFWSPFWCIASKLPN